MRLLKFDGSPVRGPSLGRKMTLLIVVLLFSPLCFAISVTGYFSKWYLSGNDYAIDFYFDRVIFEVGDPPVEASEKIWCSGYGCKIEIRAEYSSGWPMTKYQKQITPYTGDNPVRYDLADFNERVARISPFSGPITFTSSEISRYKCVQFIMNDGPRTWPLASTCDGTLPPIEPPPPVPVFCNISGLSNELIDFDVIENQDTRSASISASLSCTGAAGVTGNAQLLFTDTGRSGGNSVILNGVSNNGEIKARMSIGTEAGSNKRNLTVKNGYSDSHKLFVNIDAAEMRGKSGSFFGSALLIFEVI